MGGGDKLTILFLCSTILFAILFGVLWHREGYTSKVLQVMGIEEYIRDDWRTISGWNSSLEQAKVDADVCFFGDSITNRGDFSRIDKSQTIVTLAIPGESISGMTTRVEMLKTIQPEKIFIMAGINGLSDGSKKNADEYSKLITSIRNVVPNANIFIQSILPVNESKQPALDNSLIEETNREIKSLCDEYNITYIDLFSLYYDAVEGLSSDVSEDGLHLNQTGGYDLWYQAISKYIVG